MNGFGFIEYKDAMDARDVVPGKQTTPALFTLRSLTRPSFPYVPTPFISRLMRKL
jgi:hypothetical protein